MRAQQAYEGRGFGGVMANDIGRAMARLKHRDIRTRRRAVRTLFEHDDPSTLQAFEVLLDDEDPWFVSKALDAYRMWAGVSGNEAVETLLQHKSLDVRRAGANLLEVLGERGAMLAVEALQDADAVVQKKAARAMLQISDETFPNRMYEHQSESVRALAVQHPLTAASLLKDAMKDQSEHVQNAALARVLNDGMDVDMEVLRPFFEADIQTVNIMKWIASQAPNELVAFAPLLKPHHLNELTDHLRQHVATSDDPMIACLLNANMVRPVARWVLRKGPDEDELRWSLIENENLDVIERSKLLERLIGRAHEPDVQAKVNSFILTSPPELLMVACENLSTAASEVSS